MTPVRPTLSELADIAEAARKAAEEAYNKYERAWRTHQLLVEQVRAASITRREEHAKWADAESAAVDANFRHFYAKVDDTAQNGG